MKRNGSILGRVLQYGVLAVLAVSLAGCAVLQPGSTDSTESGGRSSDRSSVCLSCRGSGRCNPCNGTGRFLGSGQSGCSTCSGSGVCINCGGSGRW